MKKIKKPTPDFKKLLGYLYDRLDGDFIKVKDLYSTDFEKEYVKWIFKTLKKNKYIKKQFGYIFKGYKLHGAESREDFVSRAYELLMNA